MYRPTVRYDDVYKTYVDDVFRATTLDRNQIIRLALFLLPHTKEGNEILSQHLKQNASLPFPSWNHNSQWLWLRQTTKSRLEGGTSDKDVSDIQLVTTNERGEGRHENTTGYSREVSRQPGQVYENRTECGGIRFVVG